MMRFGPLWCCTVLLPPLSRAQVDHIANGAAQSLWPTLWPMIADMMPKHARGAR